MNGDPFLRDQCNAGFAVHGHTDAAQCSEVSRSKATIHQGVPGKKDEAREVPFGRVAGYGGDLRSSPSLSVILLMLSITLSSALKSEGSEGHR